MGVFASAPRKHGRSLAVITVFSISFLTGCIGGGKDFSETTLPDQAVATVTSDTLAFTRVDDVRNTGAANPPTIKGFFLGDSLDVVKIQPGIHVIEVSYRTGANQIMLQPVRVMVSASRRYKLEVNKNQVQFEEVYGDLVRNIPLYKEVLSTGDASTRPTVIINIVRPPLATKLPTAQPTTQASAEVPPAFPQPAMTYDQWLLAHPEAVKDSVTHNGDN